MSRILRPNHNDWPRRTQQRLRMLERAVAMEGTTVTSGSGDVLDANVIANPGFEEGLTGWKLGQFVGAPGRVVVNGDVVLAGALSARIDVDYPTSTQYMRPLPILDASPTERWRLSATFRTTLSNATAKLVLSTSDVTASNENADGTTGVTWVVASSSTVVSTSGATTVTADAIVPSSRNYVGAYFAVVPDPADTSAAPYTWWLDSCSLQRVLFDAAPAGP